MLLSVTAIHWTNLRNPNIKRKTCLWCQKQSFLEFMWTSSEPQSRLKHCSRQSKLSCANTSRQFVICYWIRGTLRSGGCLRSSVTFCGLRPQQFCDVALWHSGTVALWPWGTDVVRRAIRVVTVTLRGLWVINSHIYPVQWDVLCYLFQLKEMIFEDLSDQRMSL